MCSEWENHKNHGLYNPSKSYLMDLNLAKTFFIKQEKYLAFFQKNMWVYYYVKYTPIKALRLGSEFNKHE